MPRRSAIPTAVAPLPVAALVLASFLAATGSAPAQEATPQRPSLSYSASTVDGRAFEMEWGGLATDGPDAVPAFLKYGITDWLEAEAGFDLVRRVDLGGEEITSRGDLFLGARGVLPADVEDASFAAVAWVKAPTARDSAGSGEPDFGAVGIASGEIPGGLTLDLNLWLSMLGTEGGFVGQQQAIATVGLPMPGAWSAFVEGAYQNTAVLGDGLFLDAGLGYAISPRSVVDVAAGAGSSRGYPDWTVTAGWTILAVSGR